MQADFEFTVTNNGNGTVTIEAHTDASPVANPIELETGKAVSGETNLEQREDHRTKPQIKKLIELIGRDGPFSL